jgi:ferredoxin
LETIAAAFAHGAAAMRFLLRAKPRHDIEALRRTVGFATPLLGALGFGHEAVATIETDDPDALGAALAAVPRGATRTNVARFTATGGKRDVLRFALRELHRVAPQRPEVVALPAGAPFGAVQVDTGGCTLCLACVASCPTGALGDDPDQPLLRFTEDACVQCGLCKATCPEKVITLEPRLDFRSAAAAPRVLKQEEPFACERCGKEFGVRSTIEKITAKLRASHWMYQGSSSRLALLRMCEDCRGIAATEQDFDPYAPPRPLPRTSDDYLRARKDKSEDGET